MFSDSFWEFPLGSTPKTHRPTQYQQWCIHRWSPSWCISWSNPWNQRSIPIDKQNQKCIDKWCSLNHSKRVEEVLQRSLSNFLFHSIDRAIEHPSRHRGTLYADPRLSAHNHQPYRIGSLLWPNTNLKRRFEERTRWPRKWCKWSTYRNSPW